MIDPVTLAAIGQAGYSLYKTARGGAKHGPGSAHRSAQEADFARRWAGRTMEQRARFVAKQSAACGTARDPASCQRLVTIVQQLPPPTAAPTLGLPATVPYYPVEPYPPPWMGGPTQYNPPYGPTSMVPSFDPDMLAWLLGGQSFSPAPYLTPNLGAVPSSFTTAEPAFLRFAAAPSPSTPLFTPDPNAYALGLALAYGRPFA